MACLGFSFLGRAFGHVVWVLIGEIMDVYNVVVDRCCVCGDDYVVQKVKIGICGGCWRAALREKYVERVESALLEFFPWVGTDL